MNTTTNTAPACNASNYTALASLDFKALLFATLDTSADALHTCRDGGSALPPRDADFWAKRAAWAPC